MKVRQYELRHDTTLMVTWMDDNPRIRVGSKVSLKEDDEDRVWEVVWRGKQAVEKNSINCDWKVGGLT